MSMSGFLVAIGVMFVVAGGAFLVLSLRSGYHRGRTLLGAALANRTDPVDPSAIPDGGRVTLHGTVAPGPDGPTVAPLSGDDAVGARIRLQRDSEGVGWWTVTDGGRLGTFRLEGPAETVTVDAGERAPDVALEETVTADAGDDLPADLRRRLRESTVVDDAAAERLLAADAAVPRRYEEGVVAPGDDLYVHGTVVTDDTHEASVRIGGTGAAVSREPPTVSPETTEERDVDGFALARSLFKYGLLLGLSLLVLSVGVLALSQGLGLEVGV